jgi:cytoskeletal protein RodZ
MDEELVETDVPSVGERLRAAREEKGLSLEDIAAQTRIPRRHLESIEAADWDRLPAPTYTIGFARNYASVVGLDRAEVADQLRAEMGGQRTMTTTEVFEPADPARTMPKSLVIGAILAVIVLIVAMSWLRSRSLEPDETAANPPATTPAVQPTAPPPAPTPASEPVVLTATDAVWLQVYEKGGATLFAGNLQPGQTYAVPPTATAPLLKTGKPEAIRVSVGNRILPPVGPPATMVKDISLLSADLLRTAEPATAAPATPTSAAPTQPRATRLRSEPPATPAPPAETQPQPVTNAT